MCVVGSRPKADFHWKRTAALALSQTDLLPTTFVVVLLHVLTNPGNKPWHVPHLNLVFGGGRSSARVRALPHSKSDLTHYFLSSKQHTLMQQLLCAGAPTGITCDVWCSGLNTRSRSCTVAHTLPAF